VVIQEKLQWIKKSFPVI